MRPTQRLFVGAVALVAAGVGYAGGRVLLRPVPTVAQPVSFNHRLHVEEAGIECATCHELSKSGSHAGLPSLDTCAGCHDDPQAENPEIRKIAALAAAGDRDPFRKLFRIPQHTYYSHRRHAGIAAIPCETCHGAIARAESPPDAPLVRITMEFCLDCHGKESVPSDCTRCHR